MNKILMDLTVGPEKNMFQLEITTDQIEFADDNTCYNLIRPDKEKTGFVLIYFISRQNR